MNVKPFTALYDEVLIDAPGVPQNVALHVIRNAAIEFCERSMCWVADADPIASVANQAAYQFEPENGAEVAGIVQAFYSGAKIAPMTANQLDSECSQPGSTFVAGVPWNEQSGVPKYYLVERPDEFILAPYPSEAIANAIKMKLALKPSRASSGMEKWVFDKHYETLAHGAKYKLFAMQKKPWSSADLASHHKREFDSGITAASAHASHKLPAMVSAISPI